MNKYKGIIFSSSTIFSLKGEFYERVKSNHIRTAMVSNRGKIDVYTSVAEYMENVDVFVGGFDLNRYGKVRKPMPDQMFVAVAKLGLETKEVVSVVDCDIDFHASQAAGIDAVDVEDVAAIIPELASDVIKWSSENRDFSSVAPPITGIMGAIVGDVIGSYYEHHRTTDYNFKLFPPKSHLTDDSIGTLFVAKWLMGERSTEHLVKCAVMLGNSYPNAGWSHRFKAWLRSQEHAPYGATTNGSAMRVSACGWIANNLDQAINLARQSAEISHNSPEGISGAQAISASIYLTRTGKSKNDIKKYLESRFDYNLDTPVEQYRILASHDYSCEFTVPQAICCWLQSETYEQTVRNAVSLGGDADTIAAISGSLASATSGMEIPRAWADVVWQKMDRKQKGILMDFQSALQCNIIL